MKDKLTGRVGRIISGGFHALVDAVENVAPEVVMEQAIREVDGAIEEVRGELGTIIANRHMAGSRLKQINEKCEDLATKIELAVTQERDDLAEVAIARQLDLEAQQPILEEQIQNLLEEEKKLEGYIAALQAKKREMRDDLQLYRESHKEKSTESGVQQGTSSAASKAERAETAFNRVMENNTGLVGAGNPQDRATAQALNELDDMARKNRVQERLAAIKGMQKGKV